MTKTGSFFLPSRRLLILLILFPLCAVTALAQDYTLEATVSENRIFIGEQFTLSVEVSGTSMRDVSLPVLPQIDGVRVLSSTPSRGTSISIVNGRTTTSTTYSYSLIAQQAGQYTIPPASITIDGEEKLTNPIQIEVVEKGNLTPDGGRQMPDIFLKIEVDDTNPVPGQQIVASLVLYFKQGIEVTSFQPTAGWRTDGFWKEELQNIRQPSAESIILDGVRYRTATLIRYALFPSRSGTLSLSGFPLNVGIRTQPSRNDPFGSFFGSGTNQRRVSLESEPVELTVRPLPVAQNAISMNAVGNLRIERELKSREIVTGETVELVTRVEGTGNIPLIRKPGYSLPDGIDLYTPQESSNIERRGLNIRGDKTFTELLSPRAPGTYEIPAERVAVFDPQNRRYRYINLPALQFRALPGSGRQIAETGSQPIQLQPVTGLAVWNNSSSTPFWQTFWLWVLLALPFLAIATAIYKKRIQNRLLSDKTFARAHKADKLASKRIEQAKMFIEKDQPKEIYSTLHKTVAGYITDKLGLPEAGISDSELLGKIGEKGLGADLQRKTKNLLTRCATISYAPSGDRSDFRSDLEKTETLIAELRKQL